jgi:F0F1-type ATP synthase membrane subunit b/b'
MERSLKSELDKLEERRAQLREEGERVERQIEEMRVQIEEIRSRVKATAETPPKRTPQA